MRFYLGLWAAKFYLFVQKVFKRSRSDKCGLLAYRFEKNFISHLKKPELGVSKDSEVRNHIVSLGTVYSFMLFEHEV